MPRSEESARLMETMSIFATQHQVKALLEEYMRRVVARKPVDPVAFLIDEITENPFVPPPAPAPVDARPVEDLMACLDLRPWRTKERLLRGLFRRFERPDGKVDRGEMLANLQASPTIMLQDFPRHAKDLPRAIERIPTDRDGLLEWDPFLAAAEAALAGPGTSPDQ